MWPPVGGGSAVDAVLAGMSVAAVAEWVIVALTPPPTVLSLSSSSAPRKGGVGLFADALGAKVKGDGNGTSCGRVDGTATGRQPLPGHRLGRRAGTGRTAAGDEDRLRRQRPRLAAARPMVQRDTVCADPDW
jgi:hypothetical protein